MRVAATTIGGLDHLPAGVIGINGFYPGLRGISREPHFLLPSGKSGFHSECIWRKSPRSGGRVGWSSESRQKHHLRLIKYRSSAARANQPIVIQPKVPARSVLKFVDASPGCMMLSDHAARSMI